MWFNFIFDLVERFQRLSGKPLVRFANEVVAGGKILENAYAHQVVDLTPLCTVFIEKRPGLLPNRLREFMAHEVPCKKIINVVRVIQLMLFNRSAKFRESVKEEFDRVGPRYNDTEVAHQDIISRS